MNLTDIHEKLASADIEIQEQEAELQKVADEEGAAGRIMARGFSDELNKLAEVESLDQRFKRLKAANAGANPPAPPAPPPVVKQNKSLAEGGSYAKQNTLRNKVRRAPNPQIGGIGQTGSPVNRRDQAAALQGCGSGVKHAEDAGAARVKSVMGNLSSTMKKRGPLFNPAKPPAPAKPMVAPKPMAAPKAAQPPKAGAAGSEVKYGPGEGVPMPTGLKRPGEALPAKPPKPVAMPTRTRGPGESMENKPPKLPKLPGA